MQGRCGEMQGRCRGDAGEMQERCGGGSGRACSPSTALAPSVTPAADGLRTRPCTAPATPMAARRRRLAVDCLRSPARAGPEVGASAASAGLSWRACYAGQAVRVGSGVRVRGEGQG